jgi:hypothetical protein
MSTPVIPGTELIPGTERRVRHQARDVVALMAFSALVSVGSAVALLLITSLGS